METTLNLDNNDCHILTEILWFYENVMKGSGKDYTIKDKDIKQFLKKHKIKLLKRGDNIPQTGYYLQFPLLRLSCVSIIRGIRNSFAHGQVFRDGRDLVFENIYKGSLTLRGRIRRDLIKGLFDVIKNSKKD